MFDLLKARLQHGYQAVKDIKGAKLLTTFRGLPKISDKITKDEIKKCMEICPTNAITEKPFKIDMGKCIFCGECSYVSKSIEFTNFHKYSSTSRDFLFVDSKTTVESYYKDAVKVNEEIKRVFGKSLKLRSVSAGGCNGCEWELNACSNVNFDMGRFGFDVVASPRHADGIVITGPISENMAFALEETFKAIPEPKIIILMGTCAISGGVFQSSKTLDRSFINKYKIDLYIPGCPVHPLTFINGLLDFLGRK